MKCRTVVRVVVVCLCCVAGVEMEYVSVSAAADGVESFQVRCESV